MVFWLTFDGILLFVSGIVVARVEIVVSARIRAWLITNKLQKEAEIEWMRKNVLRRRGDSS